MKMTVDISEEERNKLLEEAKEEVRHELSEEAVIAYLSQKPYLNVIKALETFGLYNRYSELEEKQVKDLSHNDKMTMVLYWMIYEKLNW